MIREKAYLNKTNLNEGQHSANGNLFELYQTFVDYAALSLSFVSPSQLPAIVKVSLLEKPPDHGIDNCSKGCPDRHRTYNSLNLRQRLGHSSPNLSLLQGVSNVTQYNHLPGFTCKSSRWNCCSHGRRWLGTSRWIDLSSPSTAPRMVSECSHSSTQTQTDTSRFMQSDPFWSLVAAVTVFLVFFRRWGAERIANLYWVYILLCYGIPGAAAMVCLLYNKKGPIYGNATVSTPTSSLFLVLMPHSFGAGSTKATSGLASTPTTPQSGYQSSSHSPSTLQSASEYTKHDHNSTTPETIHIMEPEDLPPLEHHLSHSNMHQTVIL